MDYNWCRINELVRHAAHEDAKAQGLLVEEILSYLRDLVEHYGAARKVTPQFAQQVLSRTRRDFGKFWARDSEFGKWIDGILEAEVKAACCSA